MVFRSKLRLVQACAQATTEQMQQAMVWHAQVAKMTKPKGP